MSLPCVYTNCTIVRKEPRFRSPHCITVKNPQPFTPSLGTDLNECPLIGYSFKSVPNERLPNERPSCASTKKGRDRDGHAPQHQLCADRLLSEFRADNLGRCRLIEVAAGGLAQSAHDLAHLLLGRGTQLGDNLLDQGLELLTRNLRGQ